MRRLWPLVPVYVALLLWVDRGVTLHGQYALGALTWLVLIAAAWTLSPARRAQVAVVVAAATVGEVTGSLIWGVYHYRLNNLPLFVPPAHGLVYLTGIALAVSLRRHTRALVVGGGASPRSPGASPGSPSSRGSTWPARSACRCSASSSGARGTARPTRACSSRSRRSSSTAPRSAPGSGSGRCPGSGIPDGNPPSGVASGYVWFDVTALLAGAGAAQDWFGGRAKPNRACGASLAASVILRSEPTGTISSVVIPASGIVLVVGTERDEAEAGLGRERADVEDRAVVELDLHRRLGDLVLLREPLHLLLDPVDEVLHRGLLRAGDPEVRHPGQDT